MMRQDRKAQKILGMSLLGLLLIAGCTTGASSPSGSAQLRTEDCLAGFCLNKSEITESDVIEKLGEGYSQRRVPVVGNITHCYFDPAQQAWIEFTFDNHHQTRRLLQIFVSRTSVCEMRYQPKSPLQSLKTPSGIALGSTKADVLRAYGEPTRVDDQRALDRSNSALQEGYLTARYGSPVLVYLSGPDDLLFAKFYLRKNKVQSILVSISE